MQKHAAETDLTDRSRVRSIDNNVKIELTRDDAKRTMETFGDDRATPAKAISGNNEGKQPIKGADETAVMKSQGIVIKSQMYQSSARISRAD